MSKLPTEPTPGAKPPEKKPPHRPQEATPEVLSRICSYVRGGNYLVVGCDAEGFDYKWILALLRQGAKELRHMAKEGRSEPAPKYKRQVDFALEMREARAKAETEDLAAIRGDGSWQSRAWILERRSPERWGRKDRHELSGPKGGPINVKAQVENMTDEQIAARVAELRSRAKSG